MCSVSYRWTASLALAQNPRPQRRLLSSSRVDDSCLVLLSSLPPSLPPSICPSLPPSVPPSALSSLCVCICVHAHARVCMYMCVHYGTHVEVRGQLQVVLLTFLLVWGRVSCSPDQLLEWIPGDFPVSASCPEVVSGMLEGIVVQGRWGQGKDVSRAQPVLIIPRMLRGLMREIMVCHPLLRIWVIHSRTLIYQQSLCHCWESLLTLVSGCIYSPQIT